jgi:iron(III) transport system ATP-binding protein
MPAIVLRGLTKEYTPGVRAVDALDLTIPDGAFMCLLGPSGCGKTTTLRMIAGLEQPTSGEISAGDRTLDAPDRGQYVPSEKRDMGLVFQSYALWPHLSVGGNVEFGLRMRKLPRRMRADRVREVLSLLRIEHLIDRYPAQLSGGQQQRVALARMLAVKPSVLLLDEPLSNLDARLRLEMRAELKRLHDELRTTIVFVTHDQFEAMTLGTHVAVMNEGVLQQVASPMDIYRRPANVTVARFVGNPPMNLFSLGDGADPLGWRSWLVPWCDGDLPRAGWIGVRPEAVRLGADATAADGRWIGNAIVESVLPTGPTFVIQVQLDEQRLFVESFRELGVQRGDGLACAIDASAFHVFDDAGARHELKAAPGVGREKPPVRVPA